MKLTIEKDYEYVPEWNENRADEKPIVFYLKSLTEPERDKCIETRYIGNEPEVKINREKMFRYGVKRIENLNVNGDEITSAKVFLETPGLSGLFDEVTIEIGARTQGGYEKN